MWTLVVWTLSTAAVAVLVLLAVFVSLRDVFLIGEKNIKNI